MEADTNMLRVLFRKIQEEGQVLINWKEGCLATIQNKDVGKCENYRRITLLSVSGKVLNRMLLNQLKDPVDAQLRDNKARFREDRSCTY